MIIFDLDGTLADCEHRRHFVDPEKSGYSQLYNSPQCFFSKKWVKFFDEDPIAREFIPDWDAFFEACDQDTPIKPVIEILIDLWLRNGSEIQIWSGRSCKVALKTFSWIRKHIFVCGMEICPIKMRDIDDCTPDHTLKEQWLDEELARGTIIEYVFDDRPKVVQMWRRRGIFVFNCAQHDKEF